ncbi:MAG TPA: hypothetical protein VD931_11815 [Baekduia sp.]|nr:hypothetical protein [Baekduia sp.]
MATSPPASLRSLAHVATVSFLAGRLTPAGAFWVSLAGGIALAQAGARHGARAGYGASIAAMVETVAVMGPARLSGPMTQALNAPLLGALHAAGRGWGALLAACVAVRLAHYVVLNAVVIVVVVGGFDAFVDSYDSLAELTFGVLPTGAAAAIVLTVAGNLAAALGYSAVQVAVCRRALAAPGGPGAADAGPPAAAPPRASRLARALVTGLIAVWTALLAAPSWPLLAAVGALLLAGALPLDRAGRRALRLPLLLGAALGAGALVPAALGAVPLDDAAVRAVRALLLVASAGVVQAHLGPDGVRAFAAAALHRLRRIRACADAAALSPHLRADQRLLPGARELAAAVAAVAPRPGPMAEAVIGWVETEERRRPS